MAEENGSAVVLQCNVLPMVVGLQRQHGLRHNDFQRYRRFCTRRIHRLRHTIKLTHGKRTFQPAPITAANLTSEAHLEILLLEIERAWAYALEDKQDAKDTPRKRMHARTRLGKAVKHAEALKALLAQAAEEQTATVEEATQTELQAYLTWIAGVAAFENSNWERATELLTQSAQIYQGLAATPAIAADAELQKIYQQRVTEITASLRYCHYNIAQTQGHGADASKALKDLKAQLAADDAGVMAMLGERLEAALVVEHEGDADSFANVTWLGRTAPVPTLPIRQTLAQIQGRRDEMTAANFADTKEHLVAFDQLLMDYAEAERVTAKALADERAEAGSNASESSLEKQAHLQFLKAYLAAERLRTTMERNYVMVDASAARLRADEGKPDELIRLYDDQLQVVTDLETIELIQDDADAMDAIAARQAYFRALRCFYVAEVLRRTDKFKESLRLYDRTQERCTQAHAAIKRLDEPLSEDQRVQADLAMVKRSIRAVHLTMKATVALTDAQASATKSAAATTALADDLQVFDDSEAALERPLVALPPQMQPIRCKPLVFDLAIDYRQYPSLAHRLETKATAASVTSTVGGVLKSFTGGWFS
ncbi:uncharacterized protein MONBRDRAFT_39183 [Monosiga brevicollis MX1]|uniref:Signal recognition particle subunit SRP68 n=1 Tax=Monosiga brevicollis TaxID=81824 RepID=A9VCR0_MONBE|nr:uncharacterized protein MONBRDRAFT_39183 [Monosiga brevicollis MX1]EDQ84729.1 predicted protein [Monosiga brevicollis MX1]|eukprot:XP_001750515.1 hypothetical protein [Monosiga brevicollis MX1]